MAPYPCPLLPRGSAGIVRRVIDKNSGQQYACKFLRFNNPKLKEELQTELEVMAALNHPNIVQVEDGYEDKKRLAIVMEMYPTVYGTLRCAVEITCFTLDGDFLSTCC